MLWNTESPALEGKGLFRSPLLPYHVSVIWTMTVWLLSLSSSSCIGRQKVTCERRGETISADYCSGKSLGLQKDEQSPAVLNWVAPGQLWLWQGEGWAAAWTWAAQMSFKLAVKGVTSLWWQPGRTELCGTLVNFLTPGNLKSLLKQHLKKNGIFYLESG